MLLPMRDLLNRTIQVLSTAICAACCLAIPGVCHAQAYTPLSTLAALPTSSLNHMHIKLTMMYGGMSLESSVILSTDSASVNHQAFESFRREGFDYTHDEYVIPQEEPGGFRSPIVRPIAATECATLLDALVALPEVADGGLDSNPRMSLSILRADGTPVECFESILDPVNAASALFAMKAAVQTSRSARLELERLGCSHGYLSAQVPTLVSTSVLRVEFSGARRAPQLGDNMFRCKVRVRNISNQTIAAPLRLVLSTSAPLATIEPRSGNTCRTYPLGAEYFVLPVGSGLAKNSWVDVDLIIHNPQLDKLDMSYVMPGGGEATPRVFQGAGDL